MTEHLMVNELSPQQEAEGLDMIFDAIGNTFGQHNILTRISEEIEEDDQLLQDHVYCLDTAREYVIYNALTYFALSRDHRQGFRKKAIKIASLVSESHKGSNEPLRDFVNRHGQIIYSRAQSNETSNKEGRMGSILIAIAEGIVVD